MLIDVDYYRNEFYGESEEDDGTLQRYIRKASDVIQQITAGNVGDDVSDLPSFTQKQVKKATAAQAEYYVLNGTTDVGVTEDDYDSMGIGDFNFAKRAGSGNMSREEKRISSDALAHLAYTGLLYNGVDAHG